MCVCVLCVGVCVFACVRACVRPLLAAPHTACPFYPTPHRTTFIACPLQHAWLRLVRQGRGTGLCAEQVGAIAIRSEKPREECTSTKRCAQARFGGPARRALALELVCIVGPQINCVGTKHGSRKPPLPVAPASIDTALRSTPHPRPACMLLSPLPIIILFNALAVFAIAKPPSSSVNPWVLQSHCVQPLASTRPPKCLAYGMSPAPHIH